MRSYILFTTPTCSNCPEAKNVLDLKGIKYEYVDVTEDVEMRAKYRIMSAPTLLVAETGERFVGVALIRDHVEGLV